ncbi:putative oxidoreductase YcjS [Sedimentisphaera cyanobacteriorum]|uniref:Putative oxidoreductase YcjS n=1 Tax=Sedimentisphaera cyanobacteriorum TaxID=1940790 RepID=A0A1Q2HLX8_9BACT|nr:Gfo/Idh/MocA family oxidoreductase [Sedimentisphaera cyanobacteriorum]AQQ08559.1 putative oxidoreductase YcjS [Sedimentisphaera cyanobacteriorum]
MAKLRTAVIGAGKMGSLHTRIYSELELSELVAVADSDASKAGELAEKYGCRSFSDPEELIGKVDAVTIAAPTDSHLKIAAPLIENGIAVLIEKPLASSVEQGEEIARLGREKGVTVAVGHSERCNPVVQAMDRLEIKPRFIEANRVSPYPFRSTDIGVVLDVMIHDIDIILSIAGSPVKSVDAVGVDVIGQNEDICNTRIVFENGCMANVTASRLALKTERKIRIFSSQAYLSLDYFRKEGIVIQTAPNVDVVEWIRERQKEPGFSFENVNWPDLLNIENLKIEDKEPLKVEQSAFLEAAAGKRERPIVTAEEGLAALQCAYKILESIKEKAWQ